MLVDDMLGKTSVVDMAIHALDAPLGVLPFQVNLSIGHPSQFVGFN